MRKPFTFLLALLLFVSPCSAFSVETQETAWTYGHIPLEIRPDGQWDSGLGSDVRWLSDAPETAVGSGSVILAHNEGFAMLTAVLPDGSERYYDVVVTLDAVPALIRSAIDFALGEWEANRGTVFGRQNKYTAWWCGTGPKCWFGWCGGFANYCLDSAGVPMQDYNKSVPHPDGTPYAVHAAGVGKILKGFMNMERTSPLPRPGYLVIYQKRGYESGFVHVGMVTSVEDRGDGTYIVQTVEGNVSSQIKRYCYLYDSTDTTHHNYADLPEDLREDTEVFRYTVHQKEWYINCFCQTWF